MSPLLLLHFRADCNTNDIWKAAIKRGWNTERISDCDAANKSAGRERVRYYGNTLHADRIRDSLPFEFLPLDLGVLAETPLAKRAITLCRLSELAQHQFDGAFIKPAQEKWFPARVYGANETLTGGEDGNTGSLPDDLIYVQEPVNMINEVRCFCLDGKIHTSSYYRIGHEYCPISLDDHRPEAIDEMVPELASQYPRGVVLDFAYTDKREWCFIEPNEAYASGIYGCDPDKCLDVIEASQRDR